MSLENTVMDPRCAAADRCATPSAGKWGAAWRCNPAGVPLALTMGALTLRAVLAAVTRRRVRWQPIWTPTRRRAARWLAVAMLVLLEINQQSHAALLSHQ